MACQNYVIIYFGEEIKKNQRKKERERGFKTVPHIGYNKPPSIGFKKLEPKRREVFCQLIKGSEIDLSSNRQSKQSFRLTHTYNKICTCCCSLHFHVKNAVFLCFFKQILLCFFPFHSLPGKTTPFFFCMKSYNPRSK